MTRPPPRPNFHSSELLRSLADLDLLETGEAELAFAEKLGGWMHFTDAIALSSVHEAGMAKAARTSPGARLADELEAECQRVESFLVTSVRKSFLPKSANAHIKLPLLPPELPANANAMFLDYRRFYEAHQRDMELSIRPLRYKVRDALALSSPQLRKLAELDAAFERVLREREAKLLGGVPLLLRKRFDITLVGHRAALVDGAPPDSPAKWMQAGGWLAHFCAEMQALLLAEIDLRMQPAVGLVEAFRESAGASAGESAVEAAAALPATDAHDSVKPTQRPLHSRGRPGNTNAHSEQDHHE